MSSHGYSLPSPAPPSATLDAAFIGILVGMLDALKELLRGAFSTEHR
jgi:xanthosine utilization system XapX-like protein